MFIDTHAHLTAPEMLTDLEAIIERARAGGIEKIINVCTDEKSLRLGLDLARKVPWIYTAAAATPHDVSRIGTAFFASVEQEASRGTLIAIGETGLDYHYEHSERSDQQKHLLRYFDLAKRRALPLIFHCREAFGDLFSLADAHLGPWPAVLHCFTGSLKEAMQGVERGWYLSFSGILTFNKAEALREVAAHVPEDRLLLETDAPYLSPQKWRGARNEPAYLLDTACMLAEIKKKSLKELEQITRQNARSLFNF